MRNLTKIALLFICTINLVACYPMPTDDVYSVIPATNNPDFTRERASDNMMPGGSF